MDTTAETSEPKPSNDCDDASPGEVCACMLSRRCDAGGRPEDGGHIFDEVSDVDRGNAWCRCGMDIITYTCWFAGY